MATPSKNLPPFFTSYRSVPGGARSASPDATDERARARHLLAQSAIVEANRWLVVQRNWINEQHLQLCRIPAPTFFEAERAEWFRKQFAAQGWTASIDRAGNVTAIFGDPSELPRPIVLSAHLDTVFAPQRPEDIHFGPDGRLLGPGVSDNGSGLCALLVFARLLRESPDLACLAGAVQLVANVGEEGEGNLSGMRYFCRQPALLSHLRGFLVLDGPSVDHVTTKALGSRRYEIQFQGPGGHSWNDSGTPNPVHALAQVIANFTESAEARRSLQQRYSYNFGIVEGGVSINSIPAAARAKLDLRSEDPVTLEELSLLLNTAVERSLEGQNRAASAPRGWNTPPRLTAKIKDLGFRPGGQLHPESQLLRSIREVDAALKIRSRTDCASTDANVPLSLGIPAVSIGAGGQGGGAHTNSEWYSPEGRELGLQRILLILAALTNTEE